MEFRLGKEPRYEVEYDLKHSRHYCGVYSVSCCLLEGTMLVSNFTKVDLYSRQESACAGSYDFVVIRVETVLSWVSWASRVIYYACFSACFNGNGFASDHCYSIVRSVDSVHAAYQGEARVDLRIVFR